MDNKLKIDKIEIDTSLCYQGYLWLSNRNEPIVFDGKSAMNSNKKFIEDKPFTSGNPFVVEGFLYADKKSFSIKYVDGAYIAKEYSVEDREWTDVKKFVPHRMPDVERLKFIQRWVAEKDEYCENMEVLKPAGLVFAGFEWKNNGKEIKL